MTTDKQSQGAGAVASKDGLECCGQLRKEPFCAVCGKRLISNEYIGHSVGSLEYEIDQYEHDVRSTCDAVNRHEREAAIRLAELNGYRTHALEKMRKLREALAHAKKHRIGVEAL